VRLILCLLVIFTASCSVRVPHDALLLKPESLALRQLQTRKFETNDERMLLAAASSLLQDLGYQLDESEVSLGVIVASKHADATDGGQIASAVLIGVLLGAEMPIDRDQKVRVSVVTKPISKKESSLRVTFQRTIWDTRGNIARTEPIEDPNLYQEFFEKLSKAVFLEAQQI
jgi:hypothetical protein